MEVREARGTTQENVDPLGAKASYYSKVMSAGNFWRASNCSTQYCAAVGMAKATKTVQKTWAESANEITTTLTHWTVISLLGDWATHLLNPT